MTRKPLDGELKMRWWQKQDYSEVTSQKSDGYKLQYNIILCLKNDILISWRCQTKLRI